MSHFRIATLSGAAALGAFLVVPAVSAFADSPYYANITNPVPELSGQKILRSDVHVLANITNPHPELNGQADVAVATAPQSTQSAQGQQQK